MPLESKVKNIKSLSLPAVKLILLKLWATQLTLTLPWECPVPGEGHHQLTGCAPSVFTGLDHLTVTLTPTVHSLRAILRNQRVFC